MPALFGMRWFGIFVGTCVAGSILDALFPRAGYLTVDALVGLGLVTAQYFSTSARRWLMGQWR